MINGQVLVALFKASLILMVRDQEEGIDGLSGFYEPMPAYGHRDSPWEMRGCERDRERGALSLLHL